MHNESRLNIGRLRFDILPLAIFECRTLVQNQNFTCESNNKVAECDVIQYADNTCLMFGESYIVFKYFLGVKILFLNNYLLICENTNTF